jgi:hypothetical protein
LLAIMMGVTLKNHTQMVGLFINFLSDTCNSQVIYMEECPGSVSRDQPQLRGAIQGLGNSAMYNITSRQHQDKIHFSSSSKGISLYHPSSPSSHDPHSLMQITNAIVMNAINQTFKTPYFTHKRPSERRNQTGKEI